MEPNTTMDMVAADDIAAIAAAAFAGSVNLDHQDIDLAIQALTMQEIATIFTNILLKPVNALSKPYDELVAPWSYQLVVQNQAWENVEGYKVGVARAKGHCIAVESFADWVQRNKDRLEIGVH